MNRRPPWGMRFLKYGPGRPRPREAAQTLPMKKVLIIGIGAGDPDHLTLQAVKAIAAADVFFVLGKGSGEEPGAYDLVRMRKDVIRAHAREPYRLVEARDPERD